METIVSALITGGMALIGVVISNYAESSKMQQQLKIAQAVTDQKITELTREVREHNHFARRMPVMEEQVRVITGRLEGLEAYHKQPVN